MNSPIKEEFRSRNSYDSEANSCVPKLHEISPLAASMLTSLHPETIALYISFWVKLISVSKTDSNEAVAASVNVEELVNMYILERKNVSPIVSTHILSD
mmetsp:Transcript_17789/g.21786  ORF Transcript_17789/g.21786 Transcript_17789/m.21786 type:complete len:99 (-) Transcript_17789:35-331(-)